MITEPQPGSAYHRLARTGRHRWWRPVAGLLVIVVGWAGAAALLYGVVSVAAALAGRPDGPDGVPSFGAHADLTVTFLVVAALLPVTLFATWWLQRRPAGSLSSVTGRLRRRWLLWCLLPAAAALTLIVAGGNALGAATGLDTGPGGRWAGWSSFLLSLALLVLVVPVQAAAEEYAFRGYLLQAVGAFLRRPWVPIAVQSVLFAAVHGWGTAWGFADLVVFGALAGYLTVRTGGLEAAIALHVVNNLAAAGTAAALGQLTIDETAADLPWQMVAVDVPVLIAYTLVVLWLARRKRIGLVAQPEQHSGTIAESRSVLGSTLTSGEPPCSTAPSVEPVSRSAPMGSAR